jgi:hypothetical protein
MPLTRENDVTKDKGVVDNDLKRAGPRMVGENSVKRKE